LVECAAFLRSAGSAEDVVADSAPDPYGALCGLCERPCYLTRPEQLLGRTSLREAIAQRQERIGGLNKAATYAELRDLTATTRVRWFVVYPHDQLGWPAEWLHGPAFESDGFRVYDLQCIQAKD